MIILKSLEKKNLKKNDILNICKLKNSYWKYGIKSNLLWFKKNVKNNDLNIILKFNSSLIGYTLLRKRTYFSKNKRNNFFYLDTIIISNKFKGKNFGKTLISFNNFIIERFNLLGFLLCEKKNIKFYEKFGWKILNSKKFLILNKDKKNLHGMCYNSNENNFKKFNI